MNIDFSTLPGDLVLNIINIILLFVIVRTLAYKPIKKFLEERKANAANITEKANELLAEAKEEKAKYDELLKSGEDEKNRIIKDASLQADREALRIKDSARADAEKFLTDARIKAEHEHEQLISDLSDDIADMSVEICKKVLGRELTDTDNRRIIDEFFQKDDNNA